MSTSKPAPPPPKPSSRAPPPAVQQQQSKGGGVLSGLGSTIMEGFAFGTGSAIARQAVGAVFGGSSGPEVSTPASQQQPQPSSPPVVQHIDRPPADISAAQFSSQACQMDQIAFTNCMNENNSNVGSCEFFYQALQQCQADNKFAPSVV
eukprot:CAMPEP_0114445030 /NCGR_PEP_ID=MMETSP0103-20121206/18403_1 /TAXON_ID=37642 ORGANISM="Paraphysomonas imperforata, Strain PA2" /NCGR_SAMPLE_ID=MMETSP0103 /ASSEMBLY_ACC=CAM_ASM_000201 /LENGTH=148 /DNA_ID=CAMNT_0001616609 /DNA_START=87 /DNA_END=533 /DNA_ORIENTATION=+